MTVESRTLDALVLDQRRARIIFDTDSPWIQVDVQGRVGHARFAIWKATDALYVLDQGGAAGDDPVSVIEARRLVDEA